jgi:DNA topoisomerase IA
MLLVIESPNKIKKIKGYISAQILATVGHFKDLPSDAMGDQANNSSFARCILFFGLIT